MGCSGTGSYIDVILFHSYTDKFAISHLEVELTGFQICIQWGGELDKPNGQ